MKNEQLIDMILVSMQLDIISLQRLELENEQLEKLIEIKEQIESIILSQVVPELCRRAIALPNPDLDIDTIFSMIG